MHCIIKAYTLSECMEVMSKRVAEYESKGQKNIIFCEDRLTLLAERALLQKTGGTFLSSVSTFARFLNAEGRSISKQGSVMAVGEVMARLQREGVLQCFTSATGIGNNAKSIYETDERAYCDNYQKYRKYRQGREIWEHFVCISA